MDAKARLIQRLNRDGDFHDPGTPRPLVTLEEFFEGNNDPSSIGSNLSDPVGPAEFYALLKELRARPGVANVLVRVLDHDDPEGWPNTDTVWVITSATPAQVRSWLSGRIAPDEVLDGFHEAGPMEGCPLPRGHRAVGLWYD
jgi:hypothetical protein